MIEKIIFTDSFETGVFDVACAHLEKEQVAELFKDSSGIPKNDALEPDDAYTKGEIQFNFSKETEDLEEVLVFPIYEYDDSEINGDFIPAPDYIITRFADEAREFVYGKPAEPDYNTIAQNAITAFIDGRFS